MRLITAPRHEKFRMPKNEPQGESSRLMADSSGFQILMAEEKGKTMTFDRSQPMKNSAKALNISPQQVMEAAVPHQPDIVTGLDRPIRKSRRGTFKSSWKEFYKEPGSTCRGRLSLLPGKMP